MITQHKIEGFYGQKRATSYMAKVTLCMLKDQEDLASYFMSEKSEVGNLLVQQYDYDYYNYTNLTKEEAKMTVIEHAMAFIPAKIEQSYYHPKTGNFSQGFYRSQGILVLSYERVEDMNSAIRVYDVSIDYGGAAVMFKREWCMLDSQTMSFNSFSVDSLMIIEEITRGTDYHFLLVGVRTYGLVGIDLTTCSYFSKGQVDAHGNSNFKVLSINKENPRSIYAVTDTAGMAFFTYELIWNELEIQPTLKLH